MSSNAPLQVCSHLLPFPWRYAAGALAAILLGCLAATGTAAEPARAVDFARDIRPILAGNCFQCHGPDENHREADLRLDTPEGPFADLGGHAAFVAGKPEQSEAIARVTSNDPDLRMPPPEAGKPLSTEQIELLRRWVAEGARWSRHWAFVPPVRPEVPASSTSERVRNSIDRFVLRKLREEGYRSRGLGQSPAADRVTLLRRVSLDLVGLPPTIEEVDALLAEENADAAYEAAVDRLLQSPRYGERWGRDWLDAARYADSDGFEKDKPRSVWTYRDWVIDALNRDLPYDQFVIQQIAGDLLPGAGQSERIATGFLRNSMLNEEGGVDPEQFRMEAMYDRMDAVGKAVLGLTVQCAQCHSHKYDPLTQAEYYQMFACLNNCDEACQTVYPGEQLAQRAEILRQIAAIETELKRQQPDWPQQLAAWEESVREEPIAWTVLPIENAGNNSQRYYAQEDGSLLAQGYAPTRFVGEFTAETSLPVIRAFRLELLTDPNLPANGPGRSSEGLLALTEFQVERSDDKSPKPTPVKLASVTADYSNPAKPVPERCADKEGKRGTMGPVAMAIDGNNETAWGIDAGPGRRNQPRKAVFIAAEEVAASDGQTRLMFKLSQRHGGSNSNDNQNLNLGRFRISVASSPNAVADPLPAAVRQTLAIPQGKRTAEQRQALFSYWRTTVPAWREANEQIEKLWGTHPEGTTQLVLRERSEPRATHLLERGDFLKPLAAVQAGVPEFLHEQPTDNEPDRLRFARWLVDRRSPTTARAIVNRVWQSYFGTGLVATSEDLGRQSEPPSHPDLLDWLAVDFMDHGWSLKRLHRQIVMSATYRQTSHVSPERYAVDPQNRLLARGPRFRVPAEVVRDIALAASGLLVHQLGGPSVYPPAPEFLFLPPASYGTKTWNTETDGQQYRRAIYTFRFRSVPYPALETFDAPNGDAACVRRTLSNTPLQALTTLNEPLFVDCARALALRTVQQPTDDDKARLEFAFRSCLARRPSADEARLLLRLYEKQAKRFAAPTARPWELAAADAEHPPTLPKNVSPAQLAGWTVVCRVILNLDETITKE